MLGNQPTLAPLSNPQKILEVGAGTGWMSRHLAKKFPLAEEVVGIDLSPVPSLNPQETPTSSTANLKFLQGNFLELSDQDLAPNTFDYIISRLLVYGMTDWPSYIAKAKRVLQSGGILEVQELQMEAYYDEEENLMSKDWEWLREQNRIWSERGLDLSAARKLEALFRDAGFVDVQVRKFRFMVGRGKEEREFVPIAQHCHEYVGPLNVTAVRKVLGDTKTPEEMARLEKGILENFRPSDDGKHMRYWVVYGTKP